MTGRERVAVAVLLAAAYLVIGVITPRAALGATTWTTPCSSDVNTATCERLTYIADNHDDDAHRADLAWWGVWALVGTNLVVMVAPRWFAAWGWESKV